MAMTPATRSFLATLAATAVVVGVGAALVGTGAIAPAVGVAVAAKLGVGLATRYIAGRLEDTAPHGAKRSEQRLVPFESEVVRDVAGEGLVALGEVASSAGPALSLV